MFGFTATTTPDQFVIPFPQINPPDTAHPLYVYTYIGVEKNQGVRFYKSPFTELSFNTLSAAAWVITPLLITSAPPTYTTGKKIWLRLRVQCSVCGSMSPAAHASAIFDA